jgi:hypothetical protein
LNARLILRFSDCCNLFELKPYLQSNDYFENEF